MADINALGSFLPVLNQGISLIARTDRLLGSNESTRLEKEARARAELNLKQLAERQEIENEILERKAEREKAVLAAERADDERRRLAALKRAVARQRAEFSEGGIDGTSGSGDAVLLGLFSESEQEKTSRDSLHALRRQILEDNTDALRRRNLLDLSQAHARYDALND